MAAPLEGMRVLDLTSVILGPMAGQYLGDLGADVIKIEPPEGDITRTIGPRRSEGMGALFLANNRNKRSVVLDLKTGEGQEALFALAGTADVLLHSVRPSAAGRIGLDEETVRAAAPSIVYCHLKGFGDGGPYSGKAAYDDVVQALSGLAMLQKIAAGVPRYIPSIVADKIAAVHAAMAVCAALLQRERTGEGQSVDVPMLETITAFNMAEHLGGRIFEPPVGRMGYEPIRDGLRKPFATADGFLCLLPYIDRDWSRFLTIAGRPELLADPRFSTQRGRQANLTLVWTELAGIVASRNTQDWVADLAGSDIPHAAVNELEDLLDDPHLVETGFWEMRAHPTEGVLRLPAFPISFSGGGGEIRRLPPRLGEHTQSVLAELRKKNL